jgi:hypothetical protein
MKLVCLLKICLNETYNNVHIGKHLPDNFPIQNGLKQDALSPLFFNFALELNTEKTKYILLPHHQISGQNLDIKIANRSFEMWHSSNIWERLQQIKT